MTITPIERFISGENMTEEDRAARYAMRSAAAGLVKVCVWIPSDRRKAFLEAAARLRNSRTTEGEK